MRNLFNKKVTIVTTIAFAAFGFVALSQNSVVPTPNAQGSLLCENISGSVFASKLKRVSLMVHSISDELRSVS